jgi:hypothetical protein
MAAFQITNILVFLDTMSSRQTSGASAVSVFRVQYVLPGLLNQAIRVLLDCVCLGNEVRNHFIFLYGIVIWSNLLHFIRT